MRVVNAANGDVLFQTCGRDLDAWIKLAPSTYNFTVESLYTCNEAPPGNAQAVSVGPVPVN